mmetsp:Transcript_7871/g.12191  ORF Transcript_7871/g.12191 Transcript_7871/m.12191 type:complete len:90 (-) Transcript_7871:150-419(-)
MKRVPPEEKLPEILDFETKPSWVKKSDFKNRVRDDSEIVLDPSRIEKLKESEEKAEIFSLPGNHNNFSELNLQEEPSMQRRELLPSEIQ